VLVKVPLQRDQEGAEPGSPGRTPGERPTLVPKTESAVKFQLEYTALAAIQDYFEDIGDPRFGAIRILDFLPDQRAIVMEELRDPSLRQLFIRASRLRFPFTSIDLDAPLRNAGAWLCAYHALPKQDYVEARHARRADFIELVSLFTDFLGKTVGDEMFFRDIASTTVAGALEALPEALPIGLGHGDYAPRNVLVGPNNRVTVLDTLARWQAPIYEDIAYFLLGLKTNRLQVYTQGLAFSPDRIMQYARAFLAGYFGQEPIPYRAIKLYEILLLLNRWSSQAPYGDWQSVGNYDKAMRTLRWRLTDRFFRKSVNLLLQGA
jgi:hypothetical protein